MISFRQFALLVKKFNAGATIPDEQLDQMKKWAEDFAEQIQLEKITRAKEKMNS